MDFNQIIGLLIVLFVFLFPLLRKILVEKQHKQQLPQAAKKAPERHEDIPPPIHRVTPVPPLTTHLPVKQRMEFHAAAKKKEKRIIRKNINPIVLLTRRKKPLQSMVILSEIFGPPKSEQESRD